MSELHMVQISRAEAKKRGLARYFVWAPCLAGHTSARLTINSACEVCSKEKRALAYWKNREENLKKQKARRDADENLPQKRRERAVRLDPTLLDRKAERERVARLREEARLAGADTYVSGVPCNSGHTGPRYTKTGKCVECNSILCAQKRERKIQADPEKLAAREARREAKRLADIKKAERAENSRKLREAGEARRTAMESGAATYSSEWPCRRGHVGLRYTSGGGCVQCAAIASASQQKKEYDALYFEKNKERILARAKAYNEKNREAVTAKVREWVKKNPEKRAAISKAYTHRRRAKEKAGDSTAALYAWEKAAKKVCYWCNKKCADNYHIDHYVPLSGGGLHVVDNLVIACPTCNLKKNAKDPYVFAASVGRLF